jgi:hypothetical protein
MNAIQASGDSGDAAGLQRSNGAVPMRAMPDNLAADAHVGAWFGRYAAGSPAKFSYIMLFGSLHVDDGSDEVK